MAVLRGIFYKADTTINSFGPGRHSKLRFGPYNPPPKDKVVVPKGLGDAFAR